MTAAHDVELAYRRAFDEFAQWAEQVQALLANPNADRNAVQAAMLELEKARAVYYRHREEWARVLLHSSRDSYGIAHQDQDEDRLCAARGR